MVEHADLIAYLKLLQRNSRNWKTKRIKNVSTSRFTLDSPLKSKKLRVKISIHEKRWAKFYLMPTNWALVFYAPSRGLTMTSVVVGLCRVIFYLLLFLRLWELAVSDKSLFILSEFGSLHLSTEIRPIFLRVVSITSDDAGEVLASCSHLGRCLVHIRAVRGVTYR